MTDKQQARAITKACIEAGLESHITWHNCAADLHTWQAELFPPLEFHIRFADEDIGSNCSYILLREGKGEIEYINTVDFACDVWGIDPSEFV